MVTPRYMLHVKMDILKLVMILISLLTIIVCMCNIVCREIA